MDEMMRPGYYRILMTVMLCACLCLVWGGAGRSQVCAGESSSAVAPAAEEELRYTLDYLTEIATRSRLNADDTPGMVTVLYGRDLETMGIRTVAGAVSLVPGIRLALTGENVWRMVVRGVPRAFSSGQVKILLDGTPLTSAFGVDPVPNMPVEQVDRIEVVRGPVSVIHGEFADAGVMNIITRKDKNRVYGGIGQHGVYTAGGVATAEDGDGETRLSLNVAGQEAEGASLFVNPGILSSMETDGAADDAAGENTDLFRQLKSETYDGEKIYYSGIVALQTGALDLQAHGFVNRQPDLYDARLEGVSARHRVEPCDGIRVNWSLGWQTNRFSSGSDFYSVFSTVSPSKQCPYGYDYEEDQIQGRISVTADVTGAQTLMAQAELVRTGLDDISRSGDFDQIRYRDLKRCMTGLTLQDEIRLLDDLTVTAGVRRDHYDDIGDYTTPRLAAVWRLDPNGSAAGRHVLKAQLARSYRQPNFMEMILAEETGRAQDDDLTGKADTLELGYIYRSVNFLGRLTLFHSRIDPGAVMNAAGDEGGSIRSGGSEIELAFPLIPEKLMFEGNVSLVTLEKDSDHFNDGMVNIVLTAQPFRRLRLALLYRFEDPYRSLAGIDTPTNTAMDAVHRLDLTVTLTPTRLRGVVLRAGAKNLTGEDIRYPWYRNAECFGPAEDNFSLPSEQRLSRWWWVSVGFEF